MTPGHLSPFLARYLAVWIAVCGVAALLVLKDRTRLLPEGRTYLAFLGVPWKLWTFGVAAAFVTLAGRYTNDETWDAVTGAGMSVLTFLSAPWSLGASYQVLTGRRRATDLGVAIVLLLFSSSWFYDGYLLWRDGAYTARWSANLVLSPVIYVAAGLLWNLEAAAGWHAGDGRTFRLSFLRPDWPSPPVDTRFAPILIAAMPLIVVAAFFIVAFVDWHFHFLP